MSKQPDAFEKVVNKEFVDMVAASNTPVCTGAYFAAKLLRAHHKKVVRMVRRSFRTFGDMGFARVIKDDILAKLKEMEGGT